MANNDCQYGGWNSYTLQCETIMTLIYPGDCTLQCGRWLWDDIPFNSPNVRNIGILLLVSITAITAVDISFCNSL